MKNIRDFFKNEVNEAYTASVYDYVENPDETSFKIDMKKERKYCVVEYDPSMEMFAVVQFDDPDRFCEAYSLDKEWKNKMLRAKPGESFKYFGMYATRLW